VRPRVPQSARFDRFQRRRGHSRRFVDDVDDVEEAESAGDF
jgi:hypothetical protein